MTDQRFNQRAYDDAKDALKDVSTENLPKLRTLADTPAKASALADTIAKRSNTKS